MYKILHFFQYKNENDQNGTFKNFVYMENFIDLPPTHDGEIYCLKGGNGWGVPLGNEPACSQRAGVARLLYICAICYTHCFDTKKWCIVIAF